MAELQKDMWVPEELLPKCPVCGKPMTMNPRSDNSFVEDEGWHAAAKRYSNFLEARKNKKILFLEPGVGFNTPGIVKFSFWQLTMQNPNAVYACLNLKEAAAPQEITGQSICIQGDIEDVLNRITEKTLDIHMQE